MHSPGGGSYYAAMWANDQGEYMSPLFAFMDYGPGIDSALNCFRHFRKQMKPDYSPVPSSIIAEGEDVFSAAGDRGDAAMLAAGAGRFSLALGDRKTAKELWPVIEWCLEFCNCNITPHGVIASDSDELENRFPSGPANLSTSCLAYDA